uniref:Uncharacterized protein n=1 Tax=Panagrellus redivivus TaxID=6233 RepID=A0A7E4VP96_PANRE
MVLKMSPGLNDGNTDLCQRTLADAILPKRKEHSTIILINGGRPPPSLAPETLIEKKVEAPASASLSFMETHPPSVARELQIKEASLKVDRVQFLSSRQRLSSFPWFRPFLKVVRFDPSMYDGGGVVGQEGRRGGHLSQRRLSQVNLKVILTSERKIESSTFGALVLLFSSN